MAIPSSSLLPPGALAIRRVIAETLPDVRRAWIGLDVAISRKVAGRQVVCWEF